MKIKITENAIHAGKLHKKGDVVDLPAKEANAILEAGFAEEASDEEQRKSVADAKSRKELFEMYKNASKADLEKVKASAEKALAENPDYAPAKAALEVVTELLKKNS